jgi:pyrroline-5-carboxylate reductase
VKLDGTIGFLGAGNMAEALIRGLLGAGVAPENVGASCPRPERAAQLAEAYKIRATCDNCELASHSSILVFSVKPQILGRVATEVRDHIADGALVVSVAAGVPIAAIEARLRPDARVVRAMPNTPALVGAGATAISGGSHATGSDIDQTRFVFEAVGMTVVLEEEHLDAVTGLSGSGPSYIFLIIEALTDAGVKVGLSRRNALRLAAQTVMGSAKMLLDTDGHPGQLKDMVTSPGGTAIAGLHTLEQGGLRTTLINAVESATRRSRELGARYSGADSGARNNND